MHVQNRHPRPARATMLAVALILVAASFGARTARAEEDGCLANAAEAERELGIPNGLLQSLAKVESGQDDNPFAISLQGRPVMARDGKAAAKLLRDRKGKYRTNTYVGCMQLSLDVHRGAFAPVEKIVEPRQNVWYAARLLSKLHTEEGNWRYALMRYNGAKVETASGYICKVWNYLNAVDQQSAALIESASCSDTATDVAPKSRATRRARQVAAIN
jgi:hypothetical protein